jgi:hypothetical protein
MPDACMNTLEFAWIRTVIGYDGEARRDLLGKRRDSSTMFPLLERLGDSLRQTRRAPRFRVANRVAERAARVLRRRSSWACSGSARRPRSHGALAWLCCGWLRGLAWARRRRSGEDRARESESASGCSGGAGRGSPLGCRCVRTPLSAHSRRGAWTVDAAAAVTRVVDGLYAAYFAGDTADHPDALRAASLRRSGRGRVDARPSGKAVQNRCGRHVDTRFAPVWNERNRGCPQADDGENAGRETLDQIRERGGSLEITLDRRNGEPIPQRPGRGCAHSRPPICCGASAYGRAATSGFSSSIPSALGRTIEVKRGQRLVCVMSVGQNRWIFTSQVLAVTPGRDGVLEIEAPTRVERATRRVQSRVSTTSAESATRSAAGCCVIRSPRSPRRRRAGTGSARCSRCRPRRGLNSRPASWNALGEIAPDVGPGFRAELANIGGGRHRAEDRALEESRLAESSKLYWTRLDLRPDDPGPAGPDLADRTHAPR